MTRPASYPLALYRGDSYSWRFVLWQDEERTIPVDLTGAVAAAQIRDTPGGTQLITMVCAIVAPNNVDVSLPAAAWASAAIQLGAWDLQLTYSGGSVFTVVSGKVTVTPDITVP